MATTDWLTSELSKRGWSGTEFTPYKGSDERQRLRVVAKRGEETVTIEAITDQPKWRDEVMAQIKAKLDGRR